ncbi:MAG: hypothetical protein QM777_15130 [Pseudorhodoferax sp.]
MRIITLHKNARLPYVTYLKQFAGPALAGIAVLLVGYGLQQTPWASARFITATFLLPAIGLTFACYALVIWLASMAPGSPNIHDLERDLAQKEKRRCAAMKFTRLSRY